MNIFFNTSEKRIRAGWRLFLQLILMVIISGSAFWMFTEMISLNPTLTFAFPNFIAIIGSIWLAARILDKRSFFDYGLQMNSIWLRDFLAGTFFAALAMGLIFLIQWYQGWLTVTNWGWHIYEGNFIGELILFLIAMLMVGFHEELFSRGYQILNITEGLNYPHIGARGAVSIAVIVTSGLFGILHAFNPNVSWIAIFNIFAAGIILAIPYILTGSLGLSVGLHFSWNFMQAGIFGFPVSGLNFQTSVLEIQQEGSALLTGGEFGPEAGLIGLLGMAIMLGAIIVYIQKAGYSLALADRFRKSQDSPSVKRNISSRTTANP